MSVMVLEKIIAGFSKGFEVGAESDGDIDWLSLTTVKT
mgnify:CR=1 FL=1